MEIRISDFLITGQDKPALKVEVIGEAKGSSIEILRGKLPEILENEAELVYLDIRGLTDNDLGFVNEIIHMHYTLAEQSKKLILLYQKGSAFETWINTSGIDKFVELAITV